MTKFYIPSLVAPLLITVGCSTFSRKVAAPPPDSHSAQAVAEQNSTFAIPTASAPLGQLQIITLGQTQLRSRGDESVQLPALHLRMIVQNEKSVLSWSLDARDQQIHFAGIDDKIGPVYVQADSHTFPFIRVPKAATSVIDLYYILPPAFAMGQSPGFQLSWQMMAGDQSAAALSPVKHIYLDPVAEVYPLEKFQRARDLKANRLPNDAGSVSGTSLSASADSSILSSSPNPSEPVERFWWQDPFVDLPF